MPVEKTPGVIKHSISVAGHQTSVSLEEPFWAGLRQISEDRGLAIAALIAKIDAGRGSANLSSAIRIHVLAHYRDQVER